MRVAKRGDREVRGEGREEKRTSLRHYQKVRNREMREAVEEEEGEGERRASLRHMLFNADAATCPYCFF